MIDLGVPTFWLLLRMPGYVVQCCAVLHPHMKDRGFSTLYVSIISSSFRRTVSRVYVVVEMVD